MFGMYCAFRFCKKNTVTINIQRYADLLTRQNVVSITCPVDKSCMIYQYVHDIDNFFVLHLL